MLSIYFVFNYCIARRYVPKIIKVYIILMILHMRTEGGFIMIKSDVIALHEIFLIFKEKLDKDIGYCTIYDVIEDRKTFSRNEVDDIIKKIEIRHMQRNKIIAERLNPQRLALVV